MEIKRDTEDNTEPLRFNPKILLFKKIAHYGLYFVERLIKKVYFGYVSLKSKTAKNLWLKMIQTEKQIYGPEENLTAIKTFRQLRIIFCALIDCDKAYRIFFKQLIKNYCKKC